LFVTPGRSAGVSNSFHPSGSFVEKIDGQTDNFEAMMSRYTKRFGR
jgi:hypothetical protein